MEGRAESRYLALLTDRSPYISRGKEAAALTVPHLAPDESQNRSAATEYQLPWNGIGARGVHNLASRLLLALLPPTESSFRFTINEVEQAKRQQERIALGGDPETVEKELAKERTEFDMALAKLERAVLREIEVANDRVKVHEALLQVLVVGNVLLFLPKEGLQCFHLDSYVLLREPTGRPLEACVCERLSIETLEEEVKKQIAEADSTVFGMMEPERDQRDYEKTVDVYTGIEWDWDADKVTWWQEIKGVKIDGKDGSAPVEESPWIPLRMYNIAGHSYSPGYVESACIADLNVADQLTQAVTESALINAQCKFGVRPNGAARLDDWAKTANGGGFASNEGDIFPIETGKSRDTAMAEQRLAKVEARLAQAFMLADVRDSERTTAEEVRLQAQQLENSLGSIYAILTTEFQLPYINRRLALLTRTGKLPELPKDLVQPVVSVGLAAVGRGNDLEKIARFMQIGQQALTPERFLALLQPLELMRRLAGAMGIDVQGLIRTEEDLAAEQEAAMQRQQQQDLIKSAMADPQKLASAAATAQEMGQPQPPEQEQPQ
jgi:hypothetical protein